MVKPLRLFVPVVLALLSACSTSRVSTSGPERPLNADVLSEAGGEADDVVSPAALVPPSAPVDWIHLDPSDDEFPGISTTKAYETVLSGRKPARTVIVAVIDSGIDITHEDLDEVIWINEDEIPDNGIDDDGNGYVDDVNGWNFIGGPDGSHVNDDTFEFTRELARLRPRFGDVDSTGVAPADSAEYAYYLHVRAMYDAKREELETAMANLGPAESAYHMARSLFAAFLGTEEFTTEQVALAEPENPRLQQAQAILLFFAGIGIDGNDLRKSRESIEGLLRYAFDFDFEPRTTVGDTYDDLAERLYGNNDVVGPDAYHGTHVAGIIAAERENDQGIDGVADAVRIMIIRAVPNGDERDKDVANAIRYAVDNGASIINMSFGKELSPHKEAVDAAVRHAVANDVLLVHGSGNDGFNIDSTASYPSRLYLDGREAETWLEVGASSWLGEEQLAAQFSNYGKQTVDVFAPGVAVYSTTPGQRVEKSDGTSMAAPVVSGLAALLMAYYPDLSAREVRDLIVDSALPMADTFVAKPGSDGDLVPFGMLSRSGGVVSATRALALAAERVGEAGSR